MNNLYNIEQILVDNPSSPAFVVLSDIYYKQGYYKEALNICKKGLKKDPNNNIGLVPFEPGTSLPGLKIDTDGDKILDANAKKQISLLFQDC